MGFKGIFKKSLFILFYSVVIFSLVFALLPISFIYAQGEDDPVNEVHALFQTSWCYNVPEAEDAFPGGEVTGAKQWHAILENSYDATGDPVTGLILTLDTTLEFDAFKKENLTTLNPPPYEWSYGSLGEGSSTYGGTYVGFMSTTPQPYPVTFTPGYSASRSVDKTVFSQSDEPQNQLQTLTIEVTPQEDSHDIGIGVFAYENELVNPVITSVTGEGDINIITEGHDIRINLTEWSVGIPQTFTVTIQVTPKVPMIEFMPYVFIEEYFTSPISGPSIGSSLSHPVDNEAPEVGTWICSAEGSYNWYWTEKITHNVAWNPYSREIVEPVNEVHANFGTSWIYDSPGDTFTNNEVTGRRLWSADLWNAPDETGAPVTALALTFESELTCGWVGEDPVTVGPPIYEWYFGDVTEGSYVNKFVGFDTPGPPFDPSPVTFTPGFDASRSADITEFTEPGIQTLTITLTPQEATERFCINVWFNFHTWEEDNQVAVITSPISGEGIYLSPDGHWLSINPAGLEIGTIYTYYVTIKVIPKVPKLTFMPYVDVSRWEEVGSGTEKGSSVSRPASEAGTLTWSAEGDYVWRWWENLSRQVAFPMYRAPVAEASIDPYQAPVGTVFTFDGSASYDEDGTIVSYDWNFGDGTTGYGETTTHVYTSAGTYTVTLTVTDNDGATDTDTAIVTVQTPKEATQDLITDIEELNLPGGIENSLTSKLGAAINSLNNGQENAAINKLNAFINQVEAQRGKKITDEQADELIAEAQRIIDNI